MSQATLTFVLPDEAHDHDMAVHAQDLTNALASVREWLREKMKYGSLDAEEDVYVFAERVWLQFHRELTEHNVERFVL